MIYDKSYDINNIYIMFVIYHMKYKMYI